jgi:hypothetical protein
MSRHHYFDQVNCPSLLVRVEFWEGTRVAILADPEAEDGEIVIDVEDMTGRFEPPLPYVPERNPTLLVPGQAAVPSSAAARALAPPRPPARAPRR